MAKPTAAQIIKYETAHKLLFVNLVIANNMWLGMPGKFGFNPKDKTTKAYKAWYNFGIKIATIAGKWGARQMKLEAVPNAKVEKISPYLGYFLSANKQKALNDITLKLIKPGTGLGFVPLLIWAVIALIAAFSAAYIIDETTTTAQEQKSLLTETSKVIKELNIPPEKAAELLQQTQSAATENNGLFNNLTGGGLGSLLPLALLFFLFMNNKNK
jgi:hypothetical protein